MEQKEEVIVAIKKFIESADQSNTKQLAAVLHKDYRNTQIDFFEKKGVFIFDKQKYLSLIEDKIFGGTPRSIEIVNLDIVEKIAVVKVILKGEKLNFTSFISLIKDEIDEWKVIENLPSITAL
jgi:Putative lumazine-binding